MAIDLTTEAGRRAANERVARAMDPPWEHHPPTRKERSVFTDTKDIACWRRGARGNWQMAPPDFLSDDPALNDEMEKALCNAPKTVFISITLAGKLEPRPHLPQVTVWTEQRPGSSRAVDSEGKTKAEALVRALDAAGLLKEEC